ncbi:hypothetical protein LshimejAT787_0703320 [Lyophyllum shimeji]|uniref:CRIB domain-containing protein n=1 Tax=Lyophyllum shimeji TaxID=47721 RepID=A0A9P3UNZ4_LYOSH|nr:hypothetical protein LshimejAT787_0703320 [Lyophyllum shimeji]
MSSRVDDPRDPAQETKEILPYTWYRESTADTVNTMGMFLSGLIVVTRNRYLAWGALLFAISGMVNSHPIRSKDGISHGWSTLLLCISAFFASYFPFHRTPVPLCCAREQAAGPASTRPEYRDIGHWDAGLYDHHELKLHASALAPTPGAYRPVPGTVIHRMMSQLVSPCRPVLDSDRASMAIPGLSPDTYAILAVASARIYHAQLTSKIPEWCYSRMRGTLVFGKDNVPNDRGAGKVPTATEPVSYWFRLLDETSGKAIWMFKVQAGFAYELDRPFFHAFQGKSRRFGFLFDNDDEASALAKEVIRLTCPRPAKNRTLSLSLRSKSPSGSERKPMFASLISLPTPDSLVHVGHVGLNKDGVLEASKGINPSWKATLEGRSLLDHHGHVSRKASEADKLRLSEGFWRSLETCRMHDDVTAGVDKPIVAQSGVEDQLKLRRRAPAPSFTVF